MMASDDISSIAFIEDSHSRGRRDDLQIHYTPPSPPERGTTPPTDNYPSSIVSSVLWPALISLMPPHLVHLGTILISTALLTTIVLNACRPKTVTALLDTAVHRVAQNFHDIEDGFDAEEVSKLRSKLNSTRLRASKLREAALRTSGSPLKEFYAFCRGHSVRVVMCIREVEELDARIEILKVEEEQRRLKAGECMG